MNEIFHSREINHEEEPIPQRNKDADSNSLIPGPSHICHPKKEPSVNTSLMKTLSQNNITFLRALRSPCLVLTLQNVFVLVSPTLALDNRPSAGPWEARTLGASANVPGEGVRRSMLSFCRNTGILLPNSLKDRRQKSCLYFHDSLPVFTLLMGIHG